MHMPLLLQRDSLKRQAPLNGLCRGLGHFDPPSGDQNAGKGETRWSYALLRPISSWRVQESGDSPQYLKNWWGEKPGITNSTRWAFYFQLFCGVELYFEEARTSLELFALPSYTSTTQNIIAGENTTTFEGAGPLDWALSNLAWKVISGSSFNLTASDGP
jgi:hypothetical protein